jgi:hypothetical protein
MFVKLIRPKGFQRALRYNENKVEKGLGEKIHAVNFILDPPSLTIGDISQRFSRLAELNRDVVRNTVHIFIDFHAKDDLDRQKLIGVAKDYMEKIGFSRQPWLAYHHWDTPVPHLHIVGSTITSDGHNIKTLMEPHTVAELIRHLEEKYTLLSTARNAKNTLAVTGRQQPQAVQYQMSTTYHAVATTLEYVLPAYNYTSLTELNALLRQYNVWADNGKPGGRMNDNRGLVYQTLDQEGRLQGRIRASHLHFNPGLDYLETRFRENSGKNQLAIQQLSTRVQIAQLRAPADWDRFTAALRSAGVQPVPYMNAQGSIYNIVFIDHQQKLAASAHRLTDPATIKYIDLPFSQNLGHQRQLSRDLNRALSRQRQQQPLQDHTLTQLLKNQQQHTHSR